MKYLLIFLMLFQSPCLARGVYDTNNLLEENYRIEEYSNQIKEEFGVNFSLYVDPLSSNEEILKDLPRWDKLVFIIRTNQIQPSNNSIGRLYYYGTGKFRLFSKERKQIIDIFHEEDYLDESVINALVKVIEIAEVKKRNDSVIILLGISSLILGLLTGIIFIIMGIIENERKNGFLSK